MGGVSLHNAVKLRNNLRITNTVGVAVDSDNTIEMLGDSGCNLVLYFEYSESKKYSIKAIVTNNILMKQKTIERSSQLFFCNLSNTKPQAIKVAIKEIPVLNKIRPP